MKDISLYTSKVFKKLKHYKLGNVLRYINLNLRWLHC